MNAHEILQRNIDILSTPTSQEQAILPCDGGPLPSIESMKELVEQVKMIIFPGYFDRRTIAAGLRRLYIAGAIEKMYTMLTPQIGRALHIDAACDERPDLYDKARVIALQFIDKLPLIKGDIYTDVESIYGNDPAVSGYGEIIFSYPVVKAMLNYRVAHQLLLLGVPVIPRILTELAHSETGIDIHPGATIGQYFSIDHGTGVVIGQTCIIGTHVTIYQGVTLGAKNFTLDDAGHPINLPRHPIIEDNVTIYSNASVLGRITVGHDSVIGGNVWLTHSVPPNSRILQGGNQD